MTYDPFSYGQVQMNGGSKAPEDAPDDILFAGGTAPPPDSSWGLLDEDVSSLLPGSGGMSAHDFGSDILGAAPVEAAAPPPAPVRARPAAQPRPDVPAPARPAAPTPMQRPMAEIPRAAAPAAVPVATKSNGRRPSNVQIGPGSRTAGLLVPLMVVVAGGGVAAWLYLAQQNQVMGGIVVGMTVIGATFARVFLRG